jgi:hypothetical protein
MPYAFEFSSGDHVLAPVLTGIVEARLAQASVLVLLVARSVAEHGAGVVHLHLPYGPTIIADLEVPDGISPAIEFVSTYVIPPTAKEAA